MPKISEVFGKAALERLKRDTDPNKTTRLDLRDLNAGDVLFLITSFSRYQVKIIDPVMKVGEITLVDQDEENPVRRQVIIEGSSHDNFIIKHDLLIIGEQLAIRYKDGSGREFVPGTVQEVWLNEIKILPLSSVN